MPGTKTKSKGTQVALSPAKSKGKDKLKDPLKDPLEPTALDKIFNTKTNKAWQKAQARKRASDTIAKMKIEDIWQMYRGFVRQFAEKEYAMEHFDFLHGLETGENRDTLFARHIPVHSEQEINLSWALRNHLVQEYNAHGSATSRFGELLQDAESHVRYMFNATIGRMKTWDPFIDHIVAHPPKDFAKVDVPPERRIP